MVATTLHGANATSCPTIFYNSCTLKGSDGVLQLKNKSHVRLYSCGPLDLKRGRHVEHEDAGCTDALWRNGQRREHTELDFRLTISFRKFNGNWRVVHEHHSVPAAE
jgi:hypothetical protein